jgi:pyrroloquinoline quinone (PQQ) biosynthesis protein C
MSVLELGKRLPKEEAWAYTNDLHSLAWADWDRQVTNSKFMQELVAGRLSLEAIRLFWKNWAYYVFEINNLIAASYQRHIGFFKRQPDLLASFSAKLADEYMHPEPPGHIKIVLAQGEVFGLSHEDMIECQMLPGCRAYLEYSRGLLYEGTMLEWWASMICEDCVGDWAMRFHQALTDKYGFSSPQVEYFQVHEEADLRVHEENIMGHGDFNKSVVERLIETGHVDMRPGFTPEYAVTTQIAYGGMFFDTIYEASLVGAR